jgi:hypothetical protein
MDLKAAKIPRVRHVNLRPDLWIRLQVLPQIDIDVAYFAACDRWRSFGMQPVGEQFQMEARIQILAKSCEKTADDLRDELYPDEIVRAFNLWSGMQTDRLNMQTLKNKMMRAMLDDDEIIMDAMRATHAQNVSEFYGTPLPRITDAQIAYYQALTIAYDEIRGDKGGTSVKYVSEKWLKQQASPEDQRA